MPSIRDIFVRLSIKGDEKKLKGFDRGLDKVKNTANTLGRIFVTGALAIGFKKMIDLASEASESANKFAAVFGTAGDAVQMQLEDIKKRTGASGLELEKMTANIGALIKPALGSAEAAGEMAAGVSELALDIASFNDVTSDEALISLRSGLIGSAEPLQRFGVDVRVAALEQERLRQGIRTSVKDMTEGQRVTLRFAAIQRQLGVQGATGDATRTMKDFANASRNLGKVLKEVAANIGSLFLPKTGKLINTIRELVDRFQAWFKANKDILQQRLDEVFTRIGRVLGALVDIVVMAVRFVNEWVRGLDEVSQMFLKISAIAAGLAVVLLLPSGPLILMIALIALIIEDLAVMAEGGESASDDLVNAFQRATDGVTPLQTAINLLKGLIMGLADAVTIAFGGDSFSNAISGIDGMTTAINALKTALSLLVTVATLGFAEIKAGAEGMEFAVGPLGRAFGIDERLKEARERGRSQGRIFGAQTQLLGQAARLSVGALGTQRIEGPNATFPPAAGAQNNQFDVTVNIDQPNATPDQLATIVPRAVQEGLESVVRQTSQSFVTEAP